MIRILTILIVFTIVLSTVFISGCIGAKEEGKIKSNEDVTNAVSNISVDIEGVASKLEEIDSSLE